MAANLTGQVRNIADVTNRRGEWQSDPRRSPLDR